jgi:hypothetical protein
MTDRLSIRRRVEVRLPAHVAVMLGVSTAAYAVSLAAVTVSQASSEAALAAERAPAIAAIDDISARNSRLASDLEAAGTHYNAVAQGYLAAGGNLADLEAALADLATSVSQIDGVSRSMPSTVTLPKVARQVSAKSAPATSSTTGASGAP